MLLLLVAMATVRCKEWKRWFNGFSYDGFLPFLCLKYPVFCIV